MFLSTIIFSVLSLYQNYFWSSKHFQSLFYIWVRNKWTIFFFCFNQCELFIKFHGSLSNFKSTQMRSLTLAFVLIAVLVTGGEAKGGRGGGSRSRSSSSSSRSSSSGGWFGSKSSSSSSHRASTPAHNPPSYGSHGKTFNFWISLKKFNVLFS